MRCANCLKKHNQSEASLAKIARGRGTPQCPPSQSGRIPLQQPQSRRGSVPSYFLPFKPESLARRIIPPNVDRVADMVLGQLELGCHQFLLCRDDWPEDRNERHAALGLAKPSDACLHGTPAASARRIAANTSAPLGNETHLTDSATAEMHASEPICVKFP